MAVTNSGMTLYSDQDSQESWNGTDDLDDYNMSIQGTNSESWQVSKNSSETGQMSKNANMGTSKYWTCWMMSNLTNYYTSVTMGLEDSSGDEENFGLADTTNRDVTGEFHAFCMQFGQGTSSGTLDRTVITDLNVNVNNSSSGNIRSVINNWIDTSHYGDGRIIGGTTASDKLFLESHVADTTTNDEYDGCSELYKSGLSFQTDIYIATTLGNSYGEVISFSYSRNTDNIYTCYITDTSEFKGTVLIGQDGAVVGFDSTGTSTAFNWAGGGITNGNTVKFKSTDTISGLVLTATKEVDTNGASLSGTTIIGTTETTTGSLVVNSSSEGAATTDMQFKVYASNNRYAVYVPASVTSFTMSNWQFDDYNNTTDYALYWAGTSGTLTVSSTGGTNLITAGCTAASGGSVVVSASFNHTIEGLEQNTEVTYVTKDTTTVLYHVESATISDGNGKYKVNYTHAGGASVDILIHNVQYQPDISNIYGLTLPSTDATVKVQMFYDDNYLNP